MGIACLLGSSIGLADVDCIGAAFVFSWGIIITGGGLDQGGGLKAAALERGDSESNALSTSEVRAENEMSRERRASEGSFQCRGRVWA